MKKKEDSLKVALMWQNHGTEGECTKRKGIVGSDQGGADRHLTIRHNAHVTGKCALRIVALTGKPSYSKVPCNIPCNVR